MVREIQFFCVNRFVLYIYPVKGHAAIKEIDRMDLYFVLSFDQLLQLFHAHCAKYHVDLIYPGVKFNSCRPLHCVWNLDIGLPPWRTHHEPTFQSEPLFYVCCPLPQFASISTIYTVSDDCQRAHIVVLWLSFPTYFRPTCSLTNGTQMRDELSKY